MWQTKGRGDRGNTWWWNEQPKDAIGCKKKRFKIWCKTQSAKNKSDYRRTRNRAKKVLAKAMKQEAEEEMNALYNKPYDLFKFVKFMRKGGKDMHGGGGM